MDTPGPMPGFFYQEMNPEVVNWEKCWATFGGRDCDPYLVLASDGKLWLIPDRPTGTGVWGNLKTFLPPTGGPGWLGPFETFEEGWATFILMLKE